MAQGDRADLRGAPDTRGQQVRRRPRQEEGVRGAQERVLRAQRAGRGKGARRVRGKRARPEIPVGGRHVETLVGPVRPVPAVPAHAPPGGVHHQQHRIARLPAAQGQPRPRPVPPTTRPWSSCSGWQSATSRTDAASNAPKTATQPGAKAREGSSRGA